MRVSLSWLQELVELNDSVEVLAERLSIAGFEVEEIEDLTARASGVLVGFVLECQPHPNADKLSVCKVDIGQTEHLQIVCGASNIRAGIHVPVAIEGVVLPSVGITIKSSELRGIASQGMICSLAELGLVNESDGISILENMLTERYSPGDLITPLIGLDDKVIELAITANRPDGMSMVGIAREVSALTGGDLTLPVLNHNPEHELLRLDQRSSDAMLFGGIYSLTIIEGIDGSIDSPEWLKQRLDKAGVKSINLVVDVTNLVMLEQGQPLHSFDLDALEKITGKEVKPEHFGLRQAHNCETFQSLDSRELKLNERCQVVTCHDHPVALAGVTGSFDSGVSQTTKRIILEAAMFSPVAVRTTSRSVGFRTEASSRFEKGLPKEMTLASSERACELLKDFFDCRIIGRWVCGDIDLDGSPVILRRDAIHRLLGPLAKQKNEGYQSKEIRGNLINDQIEFNRGTNLERNSQLSDEVIQGSLKALGCKLETIDGGWSVLVPPSRRMDLLREVDLIEEVARLVGFDRFEINLPAPRHPGGLLPTQMAERRLRRLLCDSGLQEVTTLSLVGVDESDADRIPINNPLLADTSYLRTNLWEEHLKICQRNLQSSLSGCWLFEVGHIYTRSQSENNIDEKAVLAGAICGDRQLEHWSNSGKNIALNYFQARGVIAKALIGLKIEVIDKPLRNEARLHPGRSAQMFVEGRSIGLFGQLHPILSEKYSLPYQTYIFEINLDPLILSATRSNRWQITYKKFPTVPFLERDLAVVVDKDRTSADLMKTIRKAGKPLLEQVDLVDRFESSSLKSGCVSLAFRLRYRQKDLTLREDQVNPVQEKILEALFRDFKAELRV